MLLTPCYTKNVGVYWALAQFPLLVGCVKLHTEISPKRDELSLLLFWEAVSIPPSSKLTISFLPLQRISLTLQYPTPPAALRVRRCRERTSSSSFTQKQAPVLPKKSWGLLFVLGLFSLPEEKVGVFKNQVIGHVFHDKSIRRELDSVSMLGVEPRALYKLSTCLAKYVSVLLLTGSWLGREEHAQVWTILAGLPMEEITSHLEKVPQLAMISHKHGPEVFIHSLHYDF